MVPREPPESFRRALTQGHGRGQAERGGVGVGQGAAGRREFDAGREAARLDRRRTKVAGYRLRKIHVSLNEGTLAAMDARRAKWSGGHGISRSGFIAWALSKVLSGREARDYWAERQKADENERRDE